jgi:hypothetical protein
MEKLFTYALAIAVSLGTTVFLAKSQHASGEVQSIDVQFATDGAFRDGLFMGKLAAERGEAMHPLPGRWSADADRISFVKGYQRGYSDFLAVAAATAQNKASRQQSRD